MIASKIGHEISAVLYGVGEIDDVDFLKKVNGLFTQLGLCIMIAGE